MSRQNTVAGMIEKCAKMAKKFYSHRDTDADDMGEDKKKTTSYQMTKMLMMKLHL